MAFTPKSSQDPLRLGTPISPHTWAALPHVNGAVNIHSWRSTPAPRMPVYSCLDDTVTVILPHAHNGLHVTLQASLWDDPELHKAIWKITELPLSELEITRGLGDFYAFVSYHRGQAYRKRSLPAVEKAREQDHLVELWKRVFGDPSDPAVRARIEATVKDMTERRANLQLILGGQVASPSGGLKELHIDYREEVRRMMEDQRQEAEVQARMQKEMEQAEPATPAPAPRSWLTIRPRKGDGGITEHDVYLDGKKIEDVRSVDLILAPGERPEVVLCVSPEWVDVQAADGVTTFEVDPVSVPVAATEPVPPEVYVQVAGYVNQGAGVKPMIWLLSTKEHEAFRQTPSGDVCGFLCDLHGQSPAEILSRQTIRKGA